MTTFPMTIPGMDMKITREPVWSTSVQASIGGLEKRTSFLASPRYRFKLTFNFLRQTGPTDEAATILDFFDATYGRLGSFDFVDPYDGTTRVVRFDQDSLPMDRILSQTIHSGGQTWDGKTITFITVPA